MKTNENILNNLSRHKLIKHHYRLITIVVNKIVCSMACLGRKEEGNFFFNLDYILLLLGLNTTLPYDFVPNRDLAVVY